MNAQMSASTAPQHGSDTRTTEAGVRCVSSPEVHRRALDPDSNRFVFTYRINIVNEGETTVRLLSRYWLIADADGESHEVEGEGVVVSSRSSDPAIRTSTSPSARSPRRGARWRSLPDGPPASGHARTVALARSERARRGVQREHRRFYLVSDES